MLAKLGWMVTLNKDSLYVKVLPGKYSHNSDWLKGGKQRRASRRWKEIESTRDIINNRACYMVGDVLSINVWEDPWIPWIENFKPKPTNGDVPRITMVVLNLSGTNGQ